MATAPSRRQNESSMGALLGVTLLLGAIAGSLAGATIALLRGYSTRATPVLTNVDVAGVLVAAVVLAVLFFGPLSAMLLLAS